MQITRVRLDRAEAFEALHTFLFGGMFGTLRVPRGIEPEHVVEFIAAHLELDSEASAYERALEAVRFYERPDAALHIARVLVAPVTSVDDLNRAAFAVQALGDFGTGDLLTRADAAANALAAHPHAIDAFLLLLETHIVLAPAGSLETLARRLERELLAAREHVNRDEAGMLYHDKLAAWQRNHVPRAAGAIEAKTAVLALPVDERIKALIRIYLGRAPVSDAYMETWAGRQLRMLAMGEHAAAVQGAFDTVVGRFTAAMVDDPAKGFVFQRAVQAQMYLGGAVGEDRLRLYTAVQGGGMNFLWDDP